MRFVAPETVKIDLEGGDWIEVKKELSAGERDELIDHQMTHPNSQAGFARVMAMTFLTGWSATTDDGKPAPITEDTLKDLDTASYDAILKALTAHYEETQSAKKADTEKAMPNAATS